MSLEVDPDIRLYTRLAFGRGWRGGVNTLLWLSGIAAFAFLRVIPAVRGPWITASQRSRLRPCWR